MNKNETINRNVKFASFDQSYARCGISVFDGERLLKVLCLDFAVYEKEHGCKLKKRHKRKLLANIVKHLIEKEGVRVIVVEKTRLFSAGFISINVISAMSELIACIIDASSDDIPVVSIDTLTWKRATTGTPKRGTPVKDKKRATQEWAELLLTSTIQEKRNFRSLTDDEADSIGIGVAFIRNVKITIEE